jgi:hypothetical protein
LFTFLYMFYFEYILLYPQNTLVLKIFLCNVWEKLIK